MRVRGSINSMWQSVTRSSRLVTLVWLMGLGGSWGSCLEASERVTKEEALSLAFPGCEVIKETHYLTAAQLARATELSGTKVESGLWTAYRAENGGASCGTAYFDRHAVRTLSETLMIVVDADGVVRRIEVIAFDEPSEYLPKPAWYAQFEGKVLDADLALKKSIRPVTGASLTARATAEATRRVLAIHRVLTESARP